MERARRIISKEVTSSEYYTLKSLLLFAFSEVGKCANEHKKMIVEKVIEAFKDDLRMHLCFFDSTSSKIGDTFPNMEILVNKSLLIVDMPIPSHSILEIKSKLIVKIIDAFFRNKKSFKQGSIRGNDAILLLEILKKCIEEEQSVITFYRRCKEETKHGQLILNQLSPSLREKISKR
jgi:hypothetical protein